MGDVVTAIRWPADRENQTENRPAAILEKLRTLPWMTQVVFEVSRGGAARPPFQLLPAWQPLATLFVSTGGEWAFWTPEGYYDSSINGYHLFGWQVNRGLQVLPDFYRADQFYKKLERPDVIDRLLPAGSLREAFREAKAAPPKTELHEVLPAQIAATPRVKILSPASGVTVEGDSTLVKAVVMVPADRKLIRAKVFANGVVAPEQKQLGERNVAGGKEVTYEWKVPLPKDERNLIQVIVGTDAPTAAFSDVLVERSVIAPTPPPRLYLVVLGINKYGDPDIQPLGYSVADAEAVAAEIRSASKGLYTLDKAVVLTNQAVTPKKWRETVEQLKTSFQDARPDDLIVFFLAGHGLVDEKTHKYYFVGHDFKLSDLEKGVYTDCLSWDDFRWLGDIPCRKLVMLDTCYSGAIQPPRAGDLKNAVRQLQDDVVFTVTAATGEQRSAEKASWGHGAFTKCLLEALAGNGPTERGVRIVTLDDVIAYVKRSVPKLTDGADAHCGPGRNTPLHLVAADAREITVCRRRIPSPIDGRYTSIGDGIRLLQDELIVAECRKTGAATETHHARRKFRFLIEPAATPELAGQGGLDGRSPRARPEAGRLDGEAGQSVRAGGNPPPLSPRRLVAAVPGLGGRLHRLVGLEAAPHAGFAGRDDRLPLSAAAQRLGRRRRRAAANARPRGSPQVHRCAVGIEGVGRRRTPPTTRGRPARRTA